MSITFRCPQCAEAFTVEDGRAGKKARCPMCALRFTVPLGSEVGLLKPDGLALIDADASASRPAAPALPAFASGRGRAPQTGGWAGKGALGVTIGLLFIGLRVYMAFHRNHVAIHRNHARQAPPAARAFAPPGEVDRANAARFVMPPLPDRGPSREIEPGVSFEAVRMGPRPPGRGVPPAHGMTLWLYLPTARPAAEAGAGRPLPCVLIAPAGTPLITGYELDETREEGERPEHVPYVRAGFAVLAYGLDGDFKRGNQTEAELARASKLFLAARAGLSNAKVALEWLRAKVPEVDPGRVYTVGHSSAGTMALLLAEKEPRLRGVAAFAAPTDLTAQLDGQQQQVLLRRIPGAGEFFTTYNPAFHAQDLNCPVFLFHARDDAGLPFQGTATFAERLRGMRKDVTYEEVPDGGHYQSMIDQGIPRAIAWLQRLEGKSGQ